MKKAIIAVLILLSCGYIQAQNRNAEIIEDLCERNVKGEKNSEIGRMYIAGSAHPEYLHVADEKIINRIGIYVYNLYKITNYTHLLKDDLREIDSYKMYIELDFNTLQRAYEKYLEEENIRKQGIRVNFKDVL